MSSIKIIVLSCHLQVGNEENQQNLVTVVDVQAYTPTRQVPDTIPLMTVSRKHEVYKYALC